MGMKKSAYPPKSSSKMKLESKKSVGVPRKVGKMKQSKKVVD